MPLFRSWPLRLLLCLALVLPATAQKIRIVAANLTSGNGQSYDAGHGARILDGLNADICLIQEFNVGDNSTTAVRSFVDATFGANFGYYREGGAQIPNGIISRYPISSPEEWPDPQVNNRDFVLVKIDVPGPRDLWAISVHLHSGGGASSRQAEAVEIVRRINAKNIPAADYLVIGGDFNIDTRSEQCLSTLGSIFNTVAPHPADQDGDQGTNASRAKPYDGVYVDADLRALQVAVVTGGTTFNANATVNGAVIDTSVYQAKGHLADIAPAMSGDSSASQMQHMAVVKDFLIPLPADPPELVVTASSIVLTAPSVLSITFKSTAGAPYEVQASPSLGTGAWAVLGQITAATASTTATVVSGPPASGQVRDTELGIATRRFYRVVRK